MLGKLLKQDIKALSRYLVPFHAAVIGLALLGRLLVTDHADWSDPSPVLIIYSICFFLIFASMASITSLIIAVYFYRNLFSRHGYLSWTIPASAGQHLNSKAIAGFIWLLLDYVICLGSAVLFFVVKGIPWGEVSDVFRKTIGFSFITFLWILTLLAVIGCFCGTMSYYVAIAVGQLFSKHRVLGAIVVYFTLTFLVQIFVSIASFIELNGFMFSTAEQDLLAGAAYIQIMWRTGIISLVESIIFYVITYYIMNKKLNLN